MFGLLLRRAHHVVASLKVAQAAAGKPSDDFISVARRLECDEDKERFEAKLGKIAKAKPKTERPRGN